MSRFEVISSGEYLWMPVVDIKSSRDILDRVTVLFDVRVPKRQLLHVCDPKWEDEVSIKMYGVHVIMEE